MRKTYMKPSVEVAELELELPVAESLGVNNTKTDSWGNTNKRTNPEDIKQPEYGNLW